MTRSLDNFGVAITAGTGVGLYAVLSTGSLSSNLTRVGVLVAFRELIKGLSLDLTAIRALTLRSTRGCFGGLLSSYPFAPRMTGGIGLITLVGMIAFIALIGRVTLLRAGGLRNGFAVVVTSCRDGFGVLMTAGASIHTGTLGGAGCFCRYLGGIGMGMFFGAVLSC